MPSLHSAKVTAEKNAFVETLFDSLPEKDTVLAGSLHVKARRLHGGCLPAYIMKHYAPAEHQSTYLDAIFTNLIEGECLFVLGFQNSGFMAIRGAFDATLRFLYYETHPIEKRLHIDGKHSLHNVEFREFLYSCPDLSNLTFLSKEKVENTWADLCRYVHSDLHVLKTMSMVSDLKTLLLEPDKAFATSLNLIKHVIKVIIAVLFAVDPNWAKTVEKVYFDAILEAFTVGERREIRDNLRIA